MEIIKKIIVKISPLFVVVSKKKIINKIVVNIKLDLSIGATLLIFPSFNA